MATGNLAACLAVTLPHEGGFTNDRRDPGNWTGGRVGVGELKGTKFGIAANTYPHLDIRNLRIADAAPIYERGYWKPLRGDDLPLGVDLAVFDFGVNSGPARAARYLQAVLGVGQDGKIGPATIKAASSTPGKTTIQKLCAKRLSFMRGLAIWNTFKNGWSRRVADVEAKAVAMWLGGGGSLMIGDKRVLKEEAAKAESSAKVQKTTAGGTAGGGAAVAGGDVAVSGDLNWIVIAGVVALVVVVAGLLILKAKQNSDRAEAYAKAAAG